MTPQERISQIQAERTKLMPYEQRQKLEAEMTALILHSQIDRGQEPIAPRYLPMS